MNEQKSSQLITNDPITVEIIQKSLTAITDEMFAAMKRTAMSAIIYEVLDFGVALFDADGQLASSGSGIPGFIGMLEPGVKAVLNKFDTRSEVFEGDLFLLNIPQRGGVSHLNDVVLIIPVFSEGNIIGWLGNKAHWMDLGGAYPGGISPNSLDLYQEGLQLPCIKAMERGKIIQPVLDIIVSNSRLPTTTEGDFWAGVASMKAGEKRFLALAAKYGVPAVCSAMEDYIRTGEAISRKELKDLPKGSFSATEMLDDGREMRVTVTVTDETFLVDFRGNPKQNKSSLNSSRDATFVACQMIFMAITDPDGHGNAGSFRPIEMLVDDGSMFACRYPAAMGIYYETSMLIFDLLWKALAPSLPNKLTAGHFGSICGTFMGGPHPDTGENHGIVEPQLGGWGAAHDRDGISALYTGFHGDTFNVPIEVSEQRNGIMVDQLSLNPAMGGEGEFTGGRGIELHYRILTDDWWLTMAYVRSETGPWGLEGGLAGSTNYVEVVRPNQKVERYSACTALPLNAGDVVKVHTANGGGYGAPSKRPVSKIQADIRDEYLSPERALEVYNYQAGVPQTRT